MVKDLGLKIHYHPNPYPLGWVNKGAELKVKKQCKFRFCISAGFINEVYLDVVPLMYVESCLGVHTCTCVMQCSSGELTSIGSSRMENNSSSTHTKESQKIRWYVSTKPRN